MCGSGYERSERDRILLLYPQVSNLMNDMAKIAEVTANSSSLSLNKIAEYERRYQHIKGQLSSFSQRYRPRLSTIGNMFISEFSSPQYLGIQNTTVSGRTILESQVNSRIALDNLNFSLFATGNCFYKSWIKHSIVGSSNDGQCAGGYDSADNQAVQRKVILLSKVLIKMAEIAEVGANNYLDLGKRIRDDSDYQFLKEEVDIIGMSPVRNVSNRTQNFLTTFIDPIFLGINDTTVNGSNINANPAALENSRKALDALNFALFEINRCTN
jgi:hypothetical protein